MLVSSRVKDQLWEKVDLLGLYYLEFELLLEI